MRIENTKQVTIFVPVSNMTTFVEKKKKKVKRGLEIGKRIK